MKSRYIYTKTFFYLFMALLFMTSCQTTKVISSWNLEPIPSGSMKKVLVLGIMPDREDRDQIEKTMASELRKEGIDANTATSVFGPKGFRGLSEEQITEKLKGSSYTSVMMVSLQDKEKERNYTPGSRYTSPRVVGYSRYYRRYLYIYDYIYTPGYYTVSTNYVLEADLYTVNDDDELVYSAQTRSYDPSSAKALAEGFSKAIIAEMKEKGIIAKF